MSIAALASSLTSLSPPKQHYSWAWLPFHFHGIRYGPSSSVIPVFFNTPNPNAFSRLTYDGFRSSKRRCEIVVKAAGRRDSPYEVLGVSPSSTPHQIKRAYRKLALKYHPDVNKQADAQEKFMRIKHAYNTLLNSKSEKKYDSGSRSSGYSYTTPGRNQSRTAEQDEEFYGFGDLFRDLQEEFRNWEGSVASQGKPKSLWEELAEIGEEFVEFLEKEMNVSDDVVEEEDEENKESREEAVKDEESRLEDNIGDIEEALAKLKKELGL